MALQAPQEDTRQIDLDTPHDRDAIAQRNIAHALESLRNDSMAACKIILERYPQQTAPQPSASPAELQHQ